MAVASTKDCSRGVGHLGCHSLYVHSGVFVGGHWYGQKKKVGVFVSNQLGCGNTQTFFLWQVWYRLTYFFGVL